jgi:hypothetical protein
LSFKSVRISTNGEFYADFKSDEVAKNVPKSVIGQNFDNQFKKSVKTPYYLHVFARKKTLLGVFQFFNNGLKIG